MPAIARSLDDALSPIKDGCVLAVPRESSGAAMAATRALIRRGIKGLTLIALPTSSLQADLLIGAACVETLETSAVSLGEFGAAPRFTAAILKGSIRMKDATCPALHAAFQQQVRSVLDESGLDEQAKQSILVAMNCPCCGAGGMNYTAKINRRS